MLKIKLQEEKLEAELAMKQIHMKKKLTNGVRDEYKLAK